MFFVTKLSRQMSNSLHTLLPIQLHSLDHCNKIESAKSDTIADFVNNNLPTTDQSIFVKDIKKHFHPKVSKTFLMQNVIFLKLKYR